MNMKLSFVSSIWDDDLIESLDYNKWKCIYFDNTCELINSTEDICCVLVAKGVLELNLVDVHNHYAYSTPH